MLFLVLARSTCAPGRLGTIDRYLPEPTDDDESHTTESDGFTWNYFDDDDVIDVTVNYDPHHTTESDDRTRDNKTTTDVCPNDVPLDESVADTDLLAGQDGTNKTDDSVTVVYVADPSSTIAAYTLPTPNE